MAKNPTPKKKPVASSKVKKAPATLNDEIATLLGLASDAPLLKFPQRKSAAKLYELAVLAEILLTYRAVGGLVQLQQPTKGAANTFAGSPASADKTKYAWFALGSLQDPTEIWAEAWVSVQFSGLSAMIAHEQGVHVSAVSAKNSLHEIDLVLLSPNGTRYPSFDQIYAGVTVKHVSILQKESVREALGFRRELGYLMRGSEYSVCEWLQPNVPSNPPSPLFLVSSAPKFASYLGHVDQLGIYPRYMKFPL